ncbi:Crp/Fnr family transcriptional regulator [Arcobacter arenosus]|uniref:Crp/Fnr family transcriptional regulator n=1 Tax=Arcobacter arenosus TaxID=2576037 RepID=A0A5R8XX77_9BACT|nr:helix-turn-helix domain-containing protein [Arcobacter arenosus]TLP35545.1 Crp/Fnr family transcriptional regulator [Arcobacter arenosus]
MPFSRIKIDSVDLSSVLSEEEFNSIPIKKFSKNNIEYSDDKLNLFVFKNGKAKVSIYGDEQEFVLYHLEKNNIIIPVETCVIEFLEESEVYVIDAIQFENFFRTPSFATAVLASLKLRAEIERRIIQMLVFKNCRTRISYFLVEVALMQKYLDKKEDVVINLDFSMQEFSTFIGAKRQTVSTVFNELISEKIITKVGFHKYKILDWNRLRSF